MNSRRPMSSTGLLPPLRALGAGNDHQPANGPQPCRQEMTSKAAVRTGLPAHAAPLVGWSGMMRTIGAISDTHGLLRPQALAALAGYRKPCRQQPDTRARRPFSPTPA